jgi:hypothetical protein
MVALTAQTNVPLHLLGVKRIVLALQVAFDVTNFKILIENCVYTTLDLVLNLTQYLSSNILGATNLFYCN